MSAAESVDLSSAARVTVDAADLRRALRAVLPAAQRKSAMPVLSHVLLRATAASLVLRTTDLLMSLASEVPATVGRAFAACVSAHALEGVAARLRGPLALERVGRGLAVTSGAARFVFDGVAADDFPNAPHALGVASVLPAADLARVLALVAPAMAGDPDRPQIAGVLLERVGGRLRAVATDGHRLYVAHRTLDGGEDISPLVLPRAFVGALRAALGAKPAGAVELRRAGSVVAFGYGGLALGSKVVDVAYPDWRGVIPTPEAIRGTVTLPTAALRDAARAAMSLRPGTRARNAPALRLCAVEGRITFATDTSDGADVEGTIPAVIAGVVGSRGINAAYLFHALERLHSKTVTLEVTEGEGRGRLPGPIALRSRTNFVAVVMPVRMR